MLKLLLEPLEVSPVFVVETDQKSKGKGEGGLEWTVVGKCGGGSDDQVEEKAERRETDDNARHDSVDEEEVIGQRVAEEKESYLKHER